MASEDDEEQRRDEISPVGDVYSYCTMAAPEQRKSFGAFTYDAGLSYALVLLCVFMQGVMLFCVYKKVVVNNIEWQNGIMTVGDTNWGMLQAASDGCNNGKSLCTIKDGVYTCAPPSVQLIGHWDELDLNGDGIWTRDEVLEARTHLKCKYIVDPVEIFDVFVFLLKEREKLIWISPDVRAGKAIPKPYFTYAMGDIAMCGYRSHHMCANLLKRGVFNAALEHGTAPRVGTSIESALDYCREMLEPMGYCERVLPSTYSTWKIESIVQCQKPKYKMFVYKNPGNGVQKSLLEVDYKARQRYETAQTLIFQIYKGSICGIWMLLLISQLRRVRKVLLWVIQFPAHEWDEADLGSRPIRRGKSSRGQPKVEVVGITMNHRLFMGSVTITRIIMLCILLYVGMSFLGRQTDYIGLLLDGVALIFIIEVQEILYERALRGDVKNKWEDSDAMSINLVGIRYFNRRPDLMDVLWLVAVIVASFVFMVWYTSTIVTPLHDSLKCACVGEGENCFEHQHFSRSFWDQYWRYDLPKVLGQIKSLKKGAGGEF